MNTGGARLSTLHGVILLVEVMFSIFLSDSFFVRLFKVFGEDDVSILTDSLHTSLYGNTVVYTVNTIWLWALEE